MPPLAVVELLDVVEDRAARLRAGGPVRGVRQLDLHRREEALGHLRQPGQVQRDQAGVAWSHFHLRKQALEAHVALGRPARALLAAVEQASPRALGRVGARLYHVQHTDTRTVTTQEWRPIWQAYHARRAAARVVAGAATAGR